LCRPPPGGGTRRGQLGSQSAPGNYHEKPDVGELNTIFTSIVADILRGTSRLVDDNA